MSTLRLLTRTQFSTQGALGDKGENTGVVEINISVVVDMRLHVLLLSVTVASAALTGINVTKIGEDQFTWTSGLVGALPATDAFLSAAAEVAFYPIISNEKLSSGNATHHRNKLVLVTMASAPAMKDVVPMFLQSLKVALHPAHPATSVRKDSTDPASASSSLVVDAASQSQGQHPLANHVMVLCVTEASYTACQAIKIHQVCVQTYLPTMGETDTTQTDVGVQAAGFARVKALMDLVTHDYDVLFLDPDMVVFKDPVPYVLAVKADIRVSLGACDQVDDRQAVEHMGMENNLGVLYLRSTPGVLRCLYTWWMQMWHESADGLPSAQAMARAVFMTCAKYKLAKIAPLSAEFFPQLCMSPCGCRYTKAVETSLKPGYNATTGVKGEMVPWATGSVNCPAEMVHKWHLFHVACAGKVDQKVLEMRKYAELYRTATGLGVMTDVAVNGTAR